MADVLTQETNKDEKFVNWGTNWATVLPELSGEDLKQKIYDNTLFNILGNVKGKKMLDYGAGPAVIASRAKQLGANVKVFDVSAEMRKASADKIGPEHIYHKVEDIPNNFFDIVLCNLVVCIVPEEAEVSRLALNLRLTLKEDGVAYIGFCNPKIFNVPESIIDFRMPTGNKYEECHQYQKIKKEGGYKIVEMHRPTEWYETIFKSVGLKVTSVHLTPEYGLNGRQINDFVILEVRKLSKN